MRENASQTSTAKACFNSDLATKLLVEARIQPDLGDPIWPRLFTFQKSFLGFRLLPSLIQETIFGIYLGVLEDQEYHHDLGIIKKVQKVQKTFELHSKVGQTPRVGLNQTQWLQLRQSLIGIYLSREFCFSVGVLSELKFLQTERRIS